MYLLTDWLDHVTEFPDTYRVKENEDGTLTYEPAFGQVLQEGTPMNAANFNNMEKGIFAGNVLGAHALFLLRACEQREANFAKEFSAEIRTVTLTNTDKYPFNNSQQTVSLNAVRATANYTVDVEITSDVANVGNLIVKDKLTNGFKIAYDGSAASVTVKLTIKGGYLA